MAQKDITLIADGLVMRSDDKDAAWGRWRGNGHRRLIAYAAIRRSPVVTGGVNPLLDNHAGTVLAKLRQRAGRHSQRRLIFDGHGAKVAWVIADRGHHGTARSFARD